MKMSAGDLEIWCEIRHIGDNYHRCNLEQARVVWITL